MTKNLEKNGDTGDVPVLSGLAENLRKDEWNRHNFYKKPKFWIYALMVVVAVVLVSQLVRYQRESVSGDELGRSLKLLSTETRWVNKDVTPYKVKIVPSVTFSVRNRGKKSIRNLKFVGVFLFADSGEQMSDGVTPLMRRPLEPGETSEKITIKALFGYSASSKAAFLKNQSRWKKVNVRILAQTNAGFAKLGVVPVRQVIEGLEGDISSDGNNAETDVRMQKALKLGGSLQVMEAKSRWEDKKVTKHQAIIVPVFRFQLKNTGKTPLHHLILKGVFEFEQDGRQLTVGQTKALGDPLGPGSVSEEIAIRGEFGYAASSKAAFVHNRNKWKRVKVRVFARSRDSDDALLGIFPISRDIEGVRVVYKQAGE